MQKITVRHDAPAQQEYTIHIGSGALEQIGSLFELGQYSRIVVVTDSSVEPLLLKKLLEVLPAGTASVALDTGEKQKTIESVGKIWAALHETGCDRQSLVINLGGGVVGDVGGFAASTYMRGIAFLNIPTTLLSQVDSSVGGKVGFNFAGIKNLIGSFQQPAGIIIDPQTLRTLPERELTAGFGEIIKHGLIWDKAYFEQVTAKKPGEFSQEELADIIAGSCRIKLAVIQNDIREGGTRKLVNFGHTVGHAVEALRLESGTPLLHGEAVSIGMVAEAHISLRTDRISEADFSAIKQALRHAGLPISTGGLQPDAILKKMESDKKNSGGKLQFTLLDAIGHAVYNQEVPAPAVTEAIHAIID